jgi:hypothetical protein
MQKTEKTMLRIAAYSLKAIAEGALSLLPGTAALFARHGTLGTGSARYCYSVWLRHLIRTAPYRAAPLEGLVVELGPGDSLGIGLAALLSGASRYIAVDVIHHANAERNLAIFSELVQLFSSRAPVPAGSEFPAVKPELADYAFPEALLPPELMARNLDKSRIESISAALRDPSNDNALVHYVNPDAAIGIQTGSASMVFSQAVLEHVDDLSNIYTACHAWLSEGGLMSHQIDFKSHSTSREWNGHWAYPEATWRLLRGRRPYLINREPCGTHLEHLTAYGFDVLTAERTRLPSRLKRDQLARPFRCIMEEDLTTAGAFVIARKDTSRNLQTESLDLS